MPLREKKRKRDIVCVRKWERHSYGVIDLRNNWNA
jgi:hypothetical protein